MVDPDPELAPVIPPVIVPTVQEKVLGALDVRAIFGLVPLHMVAALIAVTTVAGETVTVIEYGVPTHKPVTDVGVTIYSTEPDNVLLGLVKV